MGQVNQSHVASAAGVSRATVSMVLNGTAGKYGISKDTAGKVLEAVKELNYTRNAWASSLKQGKSNMVGIFSWIADAPVRQLRQNIMAGYLRSRKFNVTTEDFYWTKNPGSVLMEIAGFRPEGLIICDLESRRIDSALKFMKDRGIPIVLVDAYGKRDYCNVRIDREMVGYLATRHLLEQGRERIYYTLPREVCTKKAYSNRSCYYRFMGFRRALGEANRDSHLEKYLLYMPREALAKGRNNYKWGYELGKKFLMEGVRFPAGVVTTNDQIAIGLVRALVEEGIRVPEDVAVVGNEDLPESAFCMVPLSTVRFPIEKVAHTACEMLLSKIGGARSDNHPIEIMPELVIRESSVSNKEGTGRVERASFAQ